MKMPECLESGGWISPDWLWNQLRGVETDITVLDCRSAADFSDCHIRRAVHLVLPTIMLRRLAGGKVSAINTVLKSGGLNGSKRTFVLCGSGELTNVLTKSLIQDGCPVVCLQGGVEGFREKYPEWCVTRESEVTATSSSSSEELPNLRLASGETMNGPNRTAQQPQQRLSNNGRRPGSLGSRSASDSEEERPDSSLESNEMRSVEGGPPEFGSGFSLGLSVGLRLGLESEPLPPLMLDNVDINPAVGGGIVAMDSSVDPLADPGFPVEILPHLFLGNAQNSRDCDALDKHHIRFVVNVTPNLPNVFEDSGTIQYLQIPITDHWSENLASFFPSAIRFIDGARERQEGVLVHCLAGISRSVTITVAYLMYKMSMSLNDAYDFVRRKKSNISPNFNFMGQLLDFERQLNPPSPQRCTCQHKSEDPQGSLGLPFTRLSIEEKDDEEEQLIVSPPNDSGLPSSVSLSPCSAGSSLASSPALNGTSSGTKRLRTLVCRCQASLAQCHFTTPI